MLQQSSILISECQKAANIKVKVKLSHTRYQAFGLGPGADLSVQAVSLQVTF